MPEQKTSNEALQQGAGLPAVEMSYPEAAQYVLEAEAEGVNLDEPEFLEYMADASISGGEDVAGGFFARTPGVVGEVPQGDALAQNWLAEVPTGVGGVDQGLVAHLETQASGTPEAQSIAPPTQESFLMARISAGELTISPVKNAAGNIIGQELHGTNGENIGMLPAGINATELNTALQQGEQARAQFTTPEELNLHTMEARLRSGELKLDAAARNAEGRVTSLQIVDSKGNVVFEPSRDQIAAYDLQRASAEGQAKYPPKAETPDDEIQDVQKGVDVQPHVQQENPQEGISFGAKQGFDGGAENIAAQYRPEQKPKPDFSQIEFGGKWDASKMSGETTEQAKQRVAVQAEAAATKERLEEMHRQQDKVIAVLASADEKGDMNFRLLNTAEGNKFAKLQEGDRERILNDIKSGKIDREQMMQIVDNLAGPDPSQSLEQINASPEDLKLLGKIFGRDGVNTYDVHELLAKYPRPDQLIAEIAPKSPEYAAQVNQLCHKLYGKKLEYTEAIDDLMVQAQQEGAADSVDRVHEVMDQIKDLNGQIESLQQQYDAATTEEKRAELGVQIGSLQKDLAAAEAESQRLANNTRAELEGIGEELTEEAEDIQEETTAEAEVTAESFGIAEKMKKLEDMTIKELKEFIKRTEIIVGVLESFVSVVESSGLSDEAKENFLKLLKQFTEQQKSILQEAKDILNQKLETQEDQEAEAMTMENLLNSLFESMLDESLSAEDQKKQMSLIARLVSTLLNALSANK